MDGDQAHRAFARERAELFRDPTARRAKAAPALVYFDRNKLAVLSLLICSDGDHDLLAELLLFNRLKTTSAAGTRSKNAQHAFLCTIDELDHPPAVTDRVVLVGICLDSQQGAVADAGDLVASRAAYGMQPDLGRRPVLRFIPFARNGDQLAVGVAGGDIGKHDVRQRSGRMELPAAALDQPFIRKLAQHALERHPVGIAHAEGAGNLACADLSRPTADERDELVLGRKGMPDARGQPVTWPWLCAPASFHPAQLPSDARSASASILPCVPWYGVLKAVCCSPSRHPARLLRPKVRWPAQGSPSRASYPRRAWHLSHHGSHMDRSARSSP